MPQGGLSFSCWPLDCPGQIESRVHRCQGIIARKVTSRVIGNDVPAISKEHDWHTEKPFCDQ